VVGSSPDEAPIIISDPGVPDAPLVESEPLRISSSSALGTE
jgi:hypothetical protein